MRRGPLVALAAFAALGVAVALAVGGEPPRAVVQPAGVVADVFGVNEAVSIPAARVMALDEAGRTALIDERIALVKALGVRHVRVHSASWPRLNATNPTRVGADDFLARVLEAGLEPLVMIGPWPGNAPAATTDRYVPADLDGYAAWVTATVERYDGDGKDDAPGLGKGVHAWEIDNEPDLHHTTPPRGSKVMVDDFESAADYAKVAAVTMDAILAADAGALVLPAGLFAPAGPRTASYADALWGLPAFSERFRATNTHAYPRDPAAVWDGEDRLETLAPGRARWMTEVSIGDELGEGVQARFLATLYLDALARGVERVYWHSLREPPLRAAARPGPHPSEGNHLYTGEPAHPKLAGVTMQHLLAVWGAVPRADVEGLAVSGGRALRIADDLVVWGGVVDVPVRATTRELASERLVPDALDGAALVGTSPGWTAGPVAVQDARVHIDATSGPVRIIAAFPRVR